MTALTSFIALHPYLFYSLFVLGVLIGFGGMCWWIDRTSLRQIDQQMRQQEQEIERELSRLSDRDARLKLDAIAAAPCTPWRDQVRRDVARYRVVQGGR